MATGKITKRVVDALIADAKRAGRTLIVWDAELTRFGVLATKTGAAAYVIQYRLGGRGAPSKRVTLGKHGALTPDQARKLASSQLGDVDRGRDVAQERQDARRKIAAGTFKEAVERYLAANGKNNKSWPETRRLLETDAVAALGSKPMATVSRGDVAALIDDVALRSHSVARALFAAIRPLFRWCRDRGVIDANPLLDFKGPAPLPSRKRVLEAEEIKAFWRATDAIGWPFGPLYRLLLLTGQRREEVAGMTWREVNLKRAVWTIPAARAKNGEEHAVDLSPQAIAVLESLPGERHGLVFTTTGTSPVSGFSKLKARIDGLMAADLAGQFEPWRNHDLRRTVATTMGEELDISDSTIERILNHISGTQGGLQGTYQRQKLLAKRKAAMLAWGAYVERLTAEESASGDAPACSVAAGAAAQ